MFKILLLSSLSTILLGCGTNTNSSQNPPESQTDVPLEIDQSSSSKEVTGTVYSSENNKDLGLSSEQQSRYEGLSDEGKDYMERRMKEYDEKCANSSDC